MTMNNEDTSAIRHVILAGPLRCWAQMMTAHQMAEAHGAVTHLTPGCYGEPTRKHPGMGSGCMPRDPARGYDRCRHDLDRLRAEGAVDITATTPCWTPDGGTCQTCDPDEYPDACAAPVQGALW